MAFWAQASAAPPSRPSSGPAPALTYLLSPGNNSLVAFTNLVRLRVDVPAVAAALAAAAEDAVDEETAARHAEYAACAIGRLHHIIRGIEQYADDVKLTSVLELMQDKQLQLLCSKSVVAKVYKSLLPHQTTLGYAMAPAKACLSQKPVAAWDLQESLQTAVIKTLTGCSSGTPTSANTSTQGASSGTQPTALAAAAAGPGQRGWMCLSRHKLMGCNLLAANPGQVCTTHFVDLEVKYDAGNKGVLLIITAAGSVKFRMFSPSHALQQDVRCLRAPLCPSDTDAALLADSSKLAAAARQLEGRAVKLLPGERLVFIKSLTPAPTQAAALQHLSDYWLGCFGLLLPPCFPFLVGVATHPEAEAAQMQVPSCCVLTNLGLSILPGSRPGGACHTPAVSQLVSDLQGSAAAYSFWGNQLTAQVSGDANTGAGASHAALQLSQPHHHAAHGTAAVAAAAAAPVQLKSYSLQTQWTPAAELSKLQAQASKQQRQPLQELTAAEVQLLGLAESDGLLLGCDAATGTQHGSSRQQQLLGQKGGHNNSSTSSVTGVDRFQGLRTFLAQREKEQQEQQQQQQMGGGPARPGGTAAPSRSNVLSSARSLASSSNTAGIGPAAAAAVGSRPAQLAVEGPPAAPRFGSRKPGASKPPAKAPSAAAAGGRRPGAGTVKPLPGAGLLAALQAQQLESDAPGLAAVGALAPAGAAATGGGGGATAAAAAVGGKVLASAGPAGAPALLKRPGVGEAAAKPPKKAKTAAAAAGAPGAAAAAAKPKPPKKPKAPAAPQTAGGDAATPAAAAAAAAPAGADVPAADCISPAGATGEGVPTASQQAAAAAAAAAAGDQQQAQRKHTKATDLDLAAVTAKVQAAFAASGGAALKGVSVPEMQCYLRAQGVKGGSAKRADVEARLLAVHCRGG